MRARMAAALSRCRLPDSQQSECGRSEQACWSGEIAAAKRAGADVDAAGDGIRYRVENVDAIRRCVDQIKLVSRFIKNNARRCAPSLMTWPKVAAALASGAATWPRQTTAKALIKTGTRIGSRCYNPLMNSELYYS
jgi:hypothetical protein